MPQYTEGSGFSSILAKNEKGFSYTRLLIYISGTSITFFILGVVCVFAFTWILADVGPDPSAIQPALEELGDTWPREPVGMNNGAAERPMSIANRLWEICETHFEVSRGVKAKSLISNSFQGESNIFGIARSQDGSNTNFTIEIVTTSQGGIVTVSTMPPFYRLEIVYVRSAGSEDLRLVLMFDSRDRVRIPEQMKALSEATGRSIPNRPALVRL